MTEHLIIKINYLTLKIIKYSLQSYQNGVNTLIFMNTDETTIANSVNSEGSKFQSLCPRAFADSCQFAD
jgi:hypothetical protein